MGQNIAKQLGANEIFANTTVVEKIGVTSENDDSETSERKSVDDIDKIMTMLLGEHLESLLKKNFCKKIKVFIRDEVMMKQAPTEILKLGNTIIIGQSKSTLEEHPALCKKLTDHYLKKLNLVASAYQTISESYKRIDSLRDGGQCYKKEPFALSDVDYKPAIDPEVKLEHKTLKQPYKFATRHSLEVDTSEIRRLALEKALNDNRGLVVLKEGSTSKLPTQVKSKLLIREISKPATCKTEGGKWLQTPEQLVKFNLKPSKKVSQYNRAWNDVVKNSENQIAKDSIELMAIVNNLVEEFVDISDDGKKTKRFQDKPVSEEELNDAIQNAKKLISDILSEVDKAYLVISGVPIVSESQIEYQKKMEDKKRKLEDEMKQIEYKLSSSN